MAHEIKFGDEYVNYINCPTCNANGNAPRGGYILNRKTNQYDLPCPTCGIYCGGMLAQAVPVQAQASGAAKLDQAPHVMLFIDNSSSMGYVAHAVPLAVEAFVSDQRKYSGPCDMSLYLFGDYLRCVYDREPLFKAPEFRHYGPHQGTRLRASIAHLLARQMNRPALLCVFSDGADGLPTANYADLLAEAKRKGWMFAYVGIGPHARPAEDIGFPKEHAIHVKADGGGLQKAVRALSRASVLYRDGESDFGEAMRQAEREQAEA